MQVMTQYSGWSKRNGPLGCVLHTCSFSPVGEIMGLEDLFCHWAQPPWKNGDVGKVRLSLCPLYCIQSFFFFFFFFSLQQCARTSLLETWTYTVDCSVLQGRLGCNQEGLEPAHGSLQGQQVGLRFVPSALVGRTLPGSHGVWCWIPKHPQRHFCLPTCAESLLERYKQGHLIYLFIYLFILVFLPFLGPLPCHMEVPRLGV